MADQVSTIDDYIRACPNDVQPILRRIRREIRRAVPSTGEAISYKIPTITLSGKYLVYFAAWQSHISVYPVPAGDEQFQQAIAPFRAAKGTLRFPLAKPIPYDLIARAAVLLAEERAAAR